VAFPCVKYKQRQKREKTDCVTTHTVGRRNFENKEADRFVTTNDFRNQADKINKRAQEPTLSGGTTVNRKEDVLPIDT
jgi:hypothetical protein